MIDPSIETTRGSLTPLQLVAGAGLLQNQGIAPNSEFVAAINQYNAQPVIAPLLTTITVGSGVLNSGVKANVSTLGANVCPALGDTVPQAYAGSVPNSTNPPGFTGALITRARKYLGDGDVSKFAQALSAAQGYGQVTNMFLVSAINSQTYLGGTFKGTNNLVTGGLSSFTGATEAFGKDLAATGRLIDFKNLGDFGSPIGLYRQIITVCSGVPSVLNAFVDVGIDQQVVINLGNPTFDVSDATQKLMYTAMTKITGEDLDGILKVLAVTTSGITTMADLLNPIKIFPNSYWTIVTPTIVGAANVYLGQSGSVNSSLATTLPPYILSSKV